MLAKNFADTEYPVLDPEDSVNIAMEYFLDTCYCHLPIVSEELAMGVFPTDLLMPQMDNSGKKIKDFKEDWIQVVALEEQHAIEILQLMGKFDVSAVPVVDERRVFKGVVTSSTLINRLSELEAFSVMGGIIVLSMGLRDYNLSEISRIVESNNSKILLFYMHSDEVNEIIRLTLKINTPNLRHILATFERFNYTVDFYYPTGAERDELKDRYDLLMKLFDI